LRKFVSRRGVKAGAAAVNAFRRPSWNDVHAMRSAFLAATTSSGDAGLRN
jgi:hypothetical protein